MARSGPTRTSSCRSKRSTPIACGWMRCRRCIAMAIRSVGSESLDDKKVVTDPGGYVAPPLDGIWASAPYLHNGAVPTLWHLFHADQRPTVWQRSEDGYDQEKIGLEVTTMTELPTDGHHRPRQTPLLRHAPVRQKLRGTHLPRSTRRAGKAGRDRVSEDAVAGYCFGPSRPGTLASSSSALSESLISSFALYDLPLRLSSSVELRFSTTVKRSSGILAFSETPFFANV